MERRWRQDLDAIADEVVESVKSEYTDRRSEEIK
jgi:hypothetical protein